MAALAQGCLVFMLVGSPAQERQAGLLIDGIQRSGGELARCELRVVVADPEQTPGDALRAKGATIVPLERNREVEAYPFGAKVLACAQVERTIGPPGRNLIFFDTDILVLRPQSALLLSKREDAALRPVHLVNDVGLGEDLPLDAFWAPIHAALGLRPSAVPVVESFVDARRIRAYFNCGIVSLRSERGVFREWARLFTALVADARYQARGCADERHRVFLHQAVLSDVIVARLGRSRIRLLR